MRWKMAISILLLFIAAGFTSFFINPKSKLIAPPINIYANVQPNYFSPAAQHALPRVYVPNNLDNNVDVIDPSTYQVIDQFKTGKHPQHVVPSYDLKTLWVVNNSGNSVTPIDPMTGKPGKNIKVNDPYNLYFTPDGQYAIVVCETRQRLELRDPETMALQKIIPVKCRGLNHMDFTIDNQFAIVTCEFSSQLVKVDLKHLNVVGYLTLQEDRLKTMPQDIRSSPDGKTFYVADMMANGVFLIDPISFKQIGFIPTGIGTHSLTPSRDARVVYVANRGCNHMPGKCPKAGPGSITVLDWLHNQIIDNWPIPNGGSPDMGNINASGQELWLSGRFDEEVYVFNTQTGELTHRIHVGREPHGLTVWPQPGRYSLGHTGNMR